MLTDDNVPWIEGAHGAGLSVAPGAQVVLGFPPSCCENFASDLQARADMSSDFAFVQRLMYLYQAKLALSCI